MTLSADSYNPDYFKELFAVEEQHFWFRARNHMITTLVRQIESSWESNYCILEVGCGTGNVLQHLEQSCSRGTVIGMDLYAEGLNFARERTHCSLVQGDVNAPPFRADFDLIGLFDVLEHMPDDGQVLCDAYHLLKSGGTLLLTVPAHPSLWSYFDIASRHQRRYELPLLQQKLIRAGFQVKYLTLYMASIFPLVWLFRQFATLLAKKSSNAADHAYEMSVNEFKIIPIANKVLAFILKQEQHWISRRRRLPMGTSLVAIAQKEPDALTPNSTA